MITLMQLLTHHHSCPLFVSATERLSRRPRSDRRLRASEAGRGTGRTLDSARAVIAFRQQIQRMGERPRARAIAVAGERMAQDVERTAVLQ
jgi:hypothetical protein